MLTAQVTEVHKPLLSVAQMVQQGGKVVFSRDGSYVDSPGGKHIIHLEQKGGLYTLKLWVPRNQASPFHGQAYAWS